MNENQYFFICISRSNNDDGGPFPGPSMWTQGRNPFPAKLDHVRSKRALSLASPREEILVQQHQTQMINEPMPKWCTKAHCSGGKGGNCCTFLLKNLKKSTFSIVFGNLYQITSSGITIANLPHPKWWLGEEQFFDNVPKVGRFRRDVIGCASARSGLGSFLQQQSVSNPLSPLSWVGKSYKRETFLFGGRKKELSCEMAK